MENNSLYIKNVLMNSVAFLLIFDLREKVKKGNS